MYTSHGWYIPGTLEFPGEAPDSVANCGGPLLCADCSEEVKVAHIEQSENLTHISADEINSDERLRFDIAEMVYRYSVDLNIDRIIDSSSKLYNFIRNTND